MNNFTISQIKDVEKKFGGYQYLLTFRYANLCVKADAMSLLPVTVTVGSTRMNIEDAAEVVEMGDYHLGVMPKNLDMLRDVEQGILLSHPEFRISQERMDDNDPNSAFLLCGMPDMTKERRDVLVEATKNLYDECKARMDAVLLEVKSGFAELMSEDPESLKEAADQLNEKHSDAVNDIMDLRDKKLDEIEDAYEKYLSEHPEESGNASTDSDIDVAHSIQIKQK